MSEWQLDWFIRQVSPQPEGYAGRRAADLAPDELSRLLEWMQAAYDSEIGFLDARIRAVYESLDLDRAVVFFLADHGEEFYDHGGLTHGQNLHVETTQVPLLLHLPGAQAPRGRVDAPVSTLDVVPTLRGLLQLPPSPQDQGRDLLADQASWGPVFGMLAGKSGQHALQGDLRALVSGNHRLLVTDGGAVELYDLATDPRERIDLAAARPDVVARMLRELEALEQAAPRYPPTRRLPSPPSDAMLEHLQGIGYLGGASTDDR